MNWHHVDRSRNLLTGLFFDFANLVSTLGQWASRMLHFTGALISFYQVRFSILDLTQVVLGQSVSMSTTDDLLPILTNSAMRFMSSLIMYQRTGLYGARCDFVLYSTPPATRVGPADRSSFIQQSKFTYNLGGDFLNGDGTGTFSIYGDKFEVKFPKS